MSTTGDGDLTHGGQEGPTGAVGAQAGARDGVDRNSEPRRGDSMPEAEAGGVVGASGGPREVALEGGNAEEDSDIQPAEEGEEEEAEEEDEEEHEHLKLSLCADDKILCSKSPTYKQVLF